MPRITVEKVVDAGKWVFLGYIAGYGILIFGGIVCLVVPQGGLIMAYFMLALLVAFVVLLAEVCIGRKTAIVVFLYIAYKIIHYHLY